MIYFTADLHFGHANVMRLCNRPFQSVEEMDNALIANWNGCVKPNDDIYILGDFMFKAPSGAAHRYLSQLNGRKYLIRGNHDKPMKDTELCPHDLQWIKDYFVLKQNGRQYVLFHYPILEWANYFRGAVHLYGHVHNNASSAARMEALTGPAFNVGVDCNGYKPVSIERINELAETRNIPEDH